MPKENDMTITQIHPVDGSIKIPLPFYQGPLRAGFPSAADDYLDQQLDLNEHLIHHPASTFFVKVKGDSMINAGIHSGDMLIVDRSLEPKHRNIIVAVINGEFTVKRLLKSNGNCQLEPSNPNYPVFQITGSMDFEIWSVVLHVIHSF